MKVTIHGLVKASRKRPGQDGQNTTIRITAAGLSHDLVVKLAGEHEFVMDDDLLVVTEQVDIIHGEPGTDGERAWGKYAYFYAENPAFVARVPNESGREIADLRGTGFRASSEFDLDHLYTRVVATGYIEGRPVEGKNDKPDWTAWRLRQAERTVKVSFMKEKEPKDDGKIVVIAKRLQINTWIPKDGGNERFDVSLQAATWVAVK